MKKKQQQMTIEVETKQEIQLHDEAILFLKKKGKKKLSMGQSI